MKREQNVSCLVLHDFLQVNGGAEHLVISLASGLPGFAMGTSGIYPDFTSSGDLKGLQVRLPSRLFSCLPRIPRALLTFSRGWLLPQAAACVIYSGIYAPLAVRRQTSGQRIYYCHTPPRFAFDLQAEYLQRVPALLRPALRWAIGQYRAAYLRAIRSMDRVVVNSAHVQERLQALTGIRASVIYPPIDTEHLHYLGQQGYYLSVGRLEPNKRIERVVQAFLGMPEKQLVVASGGSQLAALQVLAVGAANIRFVGWQDEVALARLIGNAIAVIYVPQDEDFGMSAVEAMAAGKPVIGVDEGGLRESIQHGISGMLLPADPSPEAIATAVIDMTPALAAGMRQACELRARDFSRARFLTAFEEIVRWPITPSEIRVLHFYRTALPDTMGGTEQVMHQLGSSSAKHGVRVEVLALSRQKEPSTVEMDGYRMHRARLDFQIASTGFSLSAFRRFAQLAKTVDLIHFHFPWPFMDLVHFATRINKPKLVTYHSDIIRQKNLLKLYRPVMHRFLASVDCIVATSPNYLATSTVLQGYRDKVRVIPIGLDRATYPEPSVTSLEQWRDRFGPRFFLFVGVLRYYKGLHILIEAARGGDYPIVIVGAGPIETELKAQVARLGLNNVHFLGHVSDEDKVALLMLCYAVVFPSHLRSEAFGISLLEGAMYGKPLISSEIGTGTTWINVANETGLVVPPSNPMALHQAMQYLWEHPAEAVAMGEKAQARYLQYFTADAMMAAYAKLYRGLLGR